MKQRFYEFGGDRSGVLGPLASDDERSKTPGVAQSGEDR
jgi:hypothetical protein